MLAKYNCKHASTRNWNKCMKCRWFHPTTEVRWEMYKAGIITFWKGFIFQLDMIRTVKGVPANG